MFEIARYEIERRLTGAVVLSVLIAVFGAFMLAFFPSVQASGAAIEEYVKNLPPALRTLFGVESMTSVGGFLAVELYQFIWVLLLGVYLAYRAASLIAGDVETRRIDLLLATPVSRSRILYERFTALVPTVLLVNLVTVPVIYLGVVLLGESLSPVRLIAVHLLSIPYLLACAGIGLVLSVAGTSESRASRIALGLVFSLFLVDSLATTTEYPWVGAVAPSRYYDPTAILTRGDIDLMGGLILVGMTVVLLGVARELFRRRDVD